MTDGVGWCWLVVALPCGYCLKASMTGWGICQGCGDVSGVDPMKFSEFPFDGVKHMQGRSRPIG